MAEKKAVKSTNETNKTRQELLRSRGGRDGAERRDKGGSRRTFLGGVVASTLGVVGLGGLTGGASASPDSEVVAEVLDERQEFIEVFVDHGILSAKILGHIEDSSTRSLVESSSVTAERDDDTDHIVISFPEESNEFEVAFGEELTDVDFTLPDDVSGEEITGALNSHVSGLAGSDVGTHAHEETVGTCCDDNGPCNICEDVAEDICQYTHTFPPMTCGSYDCGVSLCQDDNGNDALDWSCDCCGQAHGWCGAVPECFGGTHC